MTLWPDADRTARAVELVTSSSQPEGGRLLMSVLALFVATRSEAVQAERRNRARIYRRRAKHARRAKQHDLAAVLVNLADELEAVS